jgi:hypothetical protein
MIAQPFLKPSVLVVLLFFSVAARAATDASTSTAKQLYLPKKDVTRVPDDNDYDSDESAYSHKRKLEGPNVAIFWHKEFGQDPLTNPNEGKRFDVQKMLSECERFYDYYVNELTLVKKGDSVSDKYKLLIYVFEGDEGTAFGGGIEDKIGALWTPASRVHRAPYGALAHEMGHSFQFMSRVDSDTGPGGAVMEMSAQYMLWQVYPEWMTFENYHLVDFMKKTHFAFLHPTNMYHSPYVLEYWAGKHGKEFFGALSRSTQPGEDVVTTYKRMNKLEQPEFNDEMFAAACRFITWDLPRIEEVARPYANQHQCLLNEATDGWYRISPDRCPQNYGYNGIRLTVPAADTPAPGTPEADNEVQLQFQGLTGLEGFSNVKPEKAGWRYGFVAHLDDNSRIYGDVHRDAEGTTSFQVPAGTKELWLVVMGAPTEHWPVASGWGRRRREADTAEEQWPYRIKLTGTTLHESTVD